MKKGWSSFMDRRLKERLIGATILVVLIVLIVPELLSGPKKAASSANTAVAPLEAGSGDTVRNVTVDLTTSKATPGTEDTAPVGTAAAVPVPATEMAQTAPDAAANDGDAPDDAEQAPMAPAGGRKPPPTVTTLTAPRPAPEAAESEVANPRKPGSGSGSAPARDTEVPEVSKHAWAVQVGSFANKPNADKLVRHLHLQFPLVGLSSSVSGAGLRYRVRVGPLPDRHAAEHALAKLKAQHYQASLVTPSP